ncbi:LysR family transcriptional regulator [Aestuariicoccus sp. MJ-SS9]|uniref:LysR family transcriptional regulator n=1 Tax=Aestuariicoccus sp. MJ-SS9 TaxID=3079855 RepID=UPI00290FC8F9|nr:LysR family transcriptional regulator [Aestuariicoccus sp. MJ-SS9]MDU8911530.1 LysR family transcriptional regulator [Aestuariicoccus sp. MJ-SS9]
MHNADWDDLKFVLAVADGGSVSAAARALGVNHATVLRRVAAFEAAAGGPLFERSAQGYRLRPDRAPVIDAAREAARAMALVERMMQGAEGSEGAVLRVTSVDSLCLTVLPAVVAAVAGRMAPDRISLVSSNQQLDMARLQADVAVRPAAQLPDDMTGTEVAKLRFRVYAAPGAGERWLGLSGTLGASLPGRWLAAHVAPSQVGALADSFPVLRALALEGEGRAILPCVLGDDCAGLEPVACDMPDIAVPIWVACHRDLAGTPRIALLVKQIAAALRRHRSRLEGITG